LAAAGDGMKLTKNKKIMLFSGVALLLAAVWLIILAVNKPGRETSAPKGPSQGFPFFGLYADTVLTEEVRDMLGKQLGPVAVETRPILDLETVRPGFLEKNFPALNELNRRLNYEKGLKVRKEHNTVKLIYRYSSSFNYVELFFSGDTLKPLLFRIKAKKDGKDILAILQKKYGTPREIPWEDQDGKSLVWRKDKDVLILSIFSDRYGNPGYEILICHVQNLVLLLRSETDREKPEGQERLPAERSAF